MHVGHVLSHFHHQLAADRAWTCMLDLILLFGLGYVLVESCRVVSAS
jgi:hypothetical protein